MNFLDLLIGKTVEVMTDVHVKVKLTVASVEEKKHSRDLAPSTRENDWYPPTEEWTTIDITFTSGYKKSYRSLGEIDLVEFIPEIQKAGNE